MASKSTTRWQFAAYAVYSLLTCILIARHEPWFDEGQAWLIARDSSLYQLLARLLRYEGSPGLWHLVLMLPAKAGLPYAALNITAGLIAMAGTYIFLRYSPFPWYVKIIYPFTYFAFYQYAVVARSYVLLPPIIFLIAMNYEHRILHPFRFFALLILLANVSMHGFIIALGIAAVDFLDFFAARGSLGTPYTARNIIGFAGLAAASFLLIIELWPARDIITMASFKFDISNFFTNTQLMLSDALITNVSAPVKDHEVFYRVSELLYAAIILFTLFWLTIQKKLSLFLVPLTGLGLLFTAVYANVWHQGVLFFLWLFVMWLSINKTNPRQTKLSNFMKPVMLFCLLLVFSVQVYWSYNSFLDDYRNNYSASREAANFIRQNGLEGKKIYMTSFHTASVLPYFKNNIFCNFNHGQSPSYWLWSDKNNMFREPYLNLAAYEPDYILMGVKRFCEKREPLNVYMLPGVPGYRVIHYFDGSVYWKERPFELDSFALFEKIPEQPAICSEK